MTEDCAFQGCSGAPGPKAAAPVLWGQRIGEFWVGRGRGWAPVYLAYYTCFGLYLCPPQEDNHNYYVSRVYGPGERRSRDLWVDMAVANRSHVKVHRILSSSHRQASVSA